jgi:hypothetical protein
MKTDTDDLLQAALGSLESLDPEAAAASCLEAARKFAGMRKVSFDTLIAQAMAESSPGEQEALEAIRRAGHRQLARCFLEEAEAWGPGGRLHLAMAGLVADIKRRLGR